MLSPLIRAESALNGWATSVRSRLKSRNPGVEYTVFGRYFHYSPPVLRIEIAYPDRTFLAIWCRSPGKGSGFRREGKQDRSGTSLSGGVRGCNGHGGSARCRNA